MFTFRCLCLCFLLVIFMFRDDQNISKSRPLSPHLQVYKLPLSAIVSILHRISGFLLFVFLVIFSLFFASCSLGSESRLFGFLYSVVSSPFGEFVAFIWTVCFLYHLCSGIRHLLTDLGYGFSIKSIWRSSVAVFFFLVISLFILFKYLVV